VLPLGARPLQPKGEEREVSEVDTCPACGDYCPFDKRVKVIDICPTCLKRAVEEFVLEWKWTTLERALVEWRGRQRRDC